MQVVWSTIATQIALLLFPNHDRRPLIVDDLTPAVHYIKNLFFGTEFLLDEVLHLRK